MKQGLRRHTPVPWDTVFWVRPRPGFHSCSTTFVCWFTHSTVPPPEGSSTGGTAALKAQRVQRASQLLQAGTRGAALGAISCEGGSCRRNSMRMKEWGRVDGQQRGRCQRNDWGSEQMGILSFYGIVDLTGSSETETAPSATSKGGNWRRNKR